MGYNNGISAQGLLAEIEKMIDSASEKYHGAGEEVGAEFIEGVVEGIRTHSKEAKSEIAKQFEEFNKLANRFKTRKSVKTSDWRSALELSRALLQSDKYAQRVLDTMSDVKATFKGIGEVSGLQNIIKELEKAGDALESVSWSETGKYFKSQKKSNTAKPKAETPVVAADPAPVIKAEEKKQEAISETTGKMKEAASAAEKLADAEEKLNKIQLKRVKATGNIVGKNGKPIKYVPDTYTTLDGRYKIDKNDDKMWDIYDTRDINHYESIASYEKLEDVRIHLLNLVREEEKVVVSSADKQVQVLREQEAAAESAVKAQKKLNKETENILYHAGDLSNPSQTQKTYPLGHVRPSKSRSVFNGFTGLYTTEDVDGFWGTEWSGAPISTIDASKYNLFDARTDELATKAKEFFDNLNGTIYGYIEDFSTGELKRITDVKTIDELWADFNEVFKNVNMDFETFADFVKKGQSIVHGKSFADVEGLPDLDQGIVKTGEKSALQGVSRDIFNSDSFQTQLLRMLGFEGIDLRGTKHNGTYTGGTVIFDIKPESIKTVNEKWSDVMGRNGYEIEEHSLKNEEKRRQLAFDTAKAYSRQADAVEEVVEEQEKLNEATKENLGYHSGDLGKAETYGQFAYGARGTGHFGTGTYFVGDPEQIKGYNSRNGVPAPVETVDFEKYSLFKPSDTEEAYELHRVLKMINDDLDDLHRFDDLDLGSLINSYENGDTGPVLNFLNKYLNDNARSHYENEALEYKSYLESLDESKIREEASKNYRLIMSDFLDDDELSDELLIIDDLIENSVQERLEETKQALENFDIDKEIAKRIIYDIEHDKFENISNVKALKDTLVDRLSKIFVDKTKEEISNALEKTFNTISQYPESKYYEVDNASTVFMKQLGYEGIDVRHTELDNTAFGSVIYDLKGEDLERRQEILRQQAEARREDAAATEKQVEAQKKLNEESNKSMTELRGQSGGPAPAIRDNLEDELSVFESEQIEPMAAFMEEFNRISSMGFDAGKLEQVGTAIIEAISNGMSADEAIKELHNEFATELNAQFAKDSKLFAGTGIEEYLAQSLNIPNEELDYFKRRIIEVFNIMQNAPEEGAKAFEELGKEILEAGSQIVEIDNIYEDFMREYGKGAKTKVDSNGKKYKTGRIIYNEGYKAQFTSDEWNRLIKEFGFGRHLVSEEKANDGDFYIDQIEDELLKYGLKEFSDAHGNSYDLFRTFFDVIRKGRAWKQPAISLPDEEQGEINNKLNETLSVMRENANKSAEESIPGLDKEAESFEGVAKSAEKAAKAKEKFDKANKKVKDGADASSDSLDGEADSLDDVNRAAAEMPDTGDYERVTTYMDANGNPYGIRGSLDRTTADARVRTTDSYIYNDETGEWDRTGTVQTDDRIARIREMERALEEYYDIQNRIQRLRLDPSAAIHAAEVEKLETEDLVRANERLLDLGIDVNNIENQINLTARQRQALLDVELHARQEMYDVIARMEDKQATTAVKPYQKTVADELKKSAGIDTNIRLLGEDGVGSKLQAQVAAYRRLVDELVDLRLDLARDPELANDVDFSNRFADVSKRAQNARAEIEGVFKESQKLRKLGRLEIVGQEDVSGVQDLKSKMVEFAYSALEGEIKVKGFNKEGTQMYITLNQGTDAVKEVTVALDGATGRLNAFSTGTSKATNEWNDFKKQITDGAKRMAGMYLGVQDLIRYGRQGVEYVKDIDLAMTELKKVTDETDESYKQFLKDASGTSAVIGSTIRDFTDATASFARLGYSMEEASSMAETAIIYKNVAD